jgi:hypothetical protein
MTPPKSETVQTVSQLADAMTDHRAKATVLMKIQTDPPLEAERHFILMEDAVTCSGE